MKRLMPEQEVRITQEILDARILIVDDDYVSREGLLQVYRRHGFTNLAQACNGHEALAEMAEVKPDLLVIDIQMPEMDGYELCQKIRKLNDIDTSQVPILVQTAYGDSDDIHKLFMLGVSDYVCKPIDPREITARSRAHLAREFMTRSLREYNQRLAQELSVAQSTQHLLIPTHDALDRIGAAMNVNICGHLRTCNELGGDLWGVEQISDHQLMIYSADFSGHGINAALNVFRLHALMHHISNKSINPAEFLASLNSSLYAMLPTGQYTTMFYAIIDTKTEIMTYSGGGSPRPLLCRADQQSYEYLDSSGYPLGLWSDSTYELRKTPFKAGDCLLLFSDALIESKDRNGQTMSDNLLRQFFQSNINFGVEYSFRRLLDYFNQQFSVGLTDDLTLVACYRVL